VEVEVEVAEGRLAAVAAPEALRLAVAPRVVVPRAVVPRAVVAVVLQGKLSFALSSFLSLLEVCMG
jgi:hypothetical protein